MTRDHKSVPGPERPSPTRAYLKFETEESHALERARALAHSLSASHSPLRYAGRTVNYRLSDLKVVMSHRTDEGKADVFESVRASAFAFVFARFAVSSLCLRSFRARSLARAGCPALHLTVLRCVVFVSSDVRLCSSAERCRSE
jgi:hypothetical protein